MWGFTAGEESLTGTVGDVISPPIAGSRVAVVGSGVSGLTAAYLLARRFEVTLYESQDRLGGHAHTHSVTADDGQELALDTGFLVHNTRTYPHLRRLFRELGVAAQPTEMSMSIREETSGLEYAGGRGMKGVLAQRRRAVSPSFVRMLTEVKRFHRRAHAHLAAGSDDSMTFGDFLTQHGFSSDFRRLYAVPVVACVWSSGTQTALDYPATYLFTFLQNHGMLEVKNSPQWLTVVGGSRTYVEAVAAGIQAVHRGRAVTSIARTDSGVSISDQHGQVDDFAAVVLATHADEALALLADPTPTEKDVLGAFRYSLNETVLHTDDRFLPRAEQARASWNYLIPADGRARVTSDTGADQPPIVTYWLNRLQNLPTEQKFLVTLGARERIDPAAVIEVMQYTHPIYDPPALAAQKRLPELTSATTTYAGAYHGWGFHEDGARSGVGAAAAFGVSW